MSQFEAPNLRLLSGLALERPQRPKFLLRVWQNRDPYSVPDPGRVYWTAEVHRDRDQGTEVVADFAGPTREDVIVKAKAAVASGRFDEPLAEPEWLELP